MALVHGAELRREQLPPREPIARDWLEVREIDRSRVAELAAGLGVREVTARCLLGRGIDEVEAARAFLAPRLGQLRPPAGLAGLEDAVGRLARAVTGGEQIGVFGDYDVDGVTTCALITSFVRALGARCEPRVARREAGYGFGEEDVRWFSERGCRLVVTGDCGTSDIPSVALAARLGMDVVIIDHHTVPPAGAEPHPAVALVNPFRPDSTFPFQGMASVGLAFYAMAALRSRLADLGFLAGERTGPDVRALADLVALGTVADLVPLTRENRILTRYGISLLERSRRPGIAALLELAGVRGLIDERAIGWKIAPRLNAPGRMGDAQPALELLLAEDAAAAERAAEKLERANEERRQAQDRVLAEALAALPDDPGPAVVVAGRGWPSGVAGIVAARLCELFSRPAFVIGIDPETGEGRGSARSGGENLYRMLERSRDVLVRYGGHAGAAGLTVAEADVPRLRELLCLAAEAEATTEPASRALADAEVVLGEVDLELATELAALAPFGRGNEEPLLVGRDLRVRSSRRVGDGSHLELCFDDGAGGVQRAIAFGQGERDPGAGARIDAAFVAGIDEWQGRRRVGLRVERFQPIGS